MNAETTNMIRSKIDSVIKNDACLDMIWSVSPMEPKDEMFCTGTIRDGAEILIDTCYPNYSYEEEGSIDIIAYMKRGEGDFNLRSKIDKIKQPLTQVTVGNVELLNFLQDVPLEAEQAQYAIFMQLQFKAYTSRPIEQ